MRRVACIGDVHGMSALLKALYEMLCWESVDEIWHLGDLLDRGPDSGGVVRFCREKKLKGVKGNHEQSIESWRERIKSGDKPKNPDKARTVSQLVEEADWQYISELPYFHLFDDIQYAAVHAGFWDNLEWWQQPKNVCRAQLIHPDKPGKSRWYGMDPYGHSEEMSKAEGYERWYRLWTHPYGVVHGHTVFGEEPFIYRRDPYNPIVGVDTGANWTGKLTAVILPDLKFISTPLTQRITQFKTEM